MATDHEAATESSCANCGERKATVRWVGKNGGALDLIHGFSEWWCEPCVLREQIKHAEERAAVLPQLRADLEEALRG